MTPLQKVAMGLVIVVLTARFGGYDALADPVGWGLVVAGLVPLRHRMPSGGTALALAAIAGVVSLPLFLPAVEDRLSESGAWGVGLPQTTFCIVLCLALATWTERAGDRESGRFRLLRTTFLVVLVGPVLVYGGGVDELTTPVAVLSVVANVYLVYLTFAISRRPYTLAVAEPSDVAEAG